MPLAASAAPITLPTGLNPGDQYRLAFITSTFRDATSANIADYNAFVSSVANGVAELSALGVTWTAIASTNTVDARDNTSTNPSENGYGVEIFLLDDTRLAQDNWDLWDGSVQNLFGVTETGQAVGGLSVWTGSSSSGVMAAASLDGSGLAVIGYSGFVDSSWVQAGSSPLTTARPLYALSSTITVVPEPGTAALLALGMIALGIARRAS